MDHPPETQRGDSSTASTADWVKLMDDALSKGRLHAVKALIHSNPTISVAAMERAVVQGNLDCVKLLYEDCAAPIDDEMIILAALNGNTAVFEYLDSKISSHLAHWPDGVERIESNIGAELYKFEEADDVCVCLDRCEHHCLNRASQVICTSINCAVGGACGNHFESSQHMIELFDAGGVKKLGVRAKHHISSETLLIEYVGEIITNEEVKRRNYPAYTMDLEGDLYIDAVRAGNLSRFINHHCDVINCEPRRFWCGTTYRIGIVAIRNIEAGEEILFKYSNDLPFTCVCGAQSCVSK